MFLIPCPFCGERDMSEFACGGEAHIARPKDSAAMSDAEWADYVFLRGNPKGVFAERWNHAAGCRRWFNVLRNTATDQVLAVYRTGEAIIGSGNDAVKVMQAGETAEGRTGRSLRAREAGA